MVEMIDRHVFKAQICSPIQRCSYMEDQDGPGYGELNGIMSLIAVPGWNHCSRLMV
jgi:hypothetical protein